jgi:hypothetical protein
MGEGSRQAWADMEVRSTHACSCDTKTPPITDEYDVQTDEVRTLPLERLFRDPDEVVDDTERLSVL